MASWVHDHEREMGAFPAREEASDMLREERDLWDGWKEFQLGEVQQGEQEDAQGETQKVQRGRAEALPAFAAAALGLLVPLFSLLAHGLDVELLLPRTF